jgi:GNAT superfamily N-acetyltransferase
MNDPIVNWLKSDFDQILLEIADFWGSDRTLHLHHPMFLYEFGNSAFVTRRGGKVLAYLFGCLAQTGPTAYVHLIGVCRSHQRKGLGRRLYEHFIEFARNHGCNEIKAITSPSNTQSILFHKAIGMELMKGPDQTEIPVVKDYSGPGKDAAVFRRKIL